MKIRLARPAGLILIALTLAAAVPHASAEPISVRIHPIGGRECALLPGDHPVPPPAGHVPCPGVRPGGWVAAPEGACTLNFLYEGYRPDDSKAGRFIGTAGHCVLGVDGEREWAKGTGPVARNASGARIGEFAYAVLRGDKDFALIRIDPDVAANPRMCYWGGPTGTNTSRPEAPVVLRHFGNGFAFGNVVPARTAVALGMPSSEHVFANGAAIMGDSGSGVLSEDGRAVGVLVSVGLNYGGPSDVGNIVITRLAPQVRGAERLLDLRLVLETASVASEVVPLGREPTDG